ncbi:MAG: replication protein P [Gammaproteobacteria bacterium]
MLGQKKSISNKEDFIKSIDALFLKLELAYHYQFYKVFGTDEKLKEGKKLWAISLKDIAPEIILDAVENVISSQSYLPTLTDLMKACNDINRMDGFPSVEEAYVEARRSYQPRASYNWSHPIVYFVGKKIGWNIINEKDSKENFNTFKHIFNALKIQAIEGKEFKIKQSKVLNDRKPLNPDLFKKLREKHKV